MIKIATPVSTLFAQAPAALPEILALSDALELRDHSPAVDSSLPRLFHCEASIVEPWPKGEAERIAGIVKANDVELLTLHLNSCFVKPPVADGMFQPEGQKMTAREMKQNAQQNKDALLAKLGKPVAIAVENNNYYPTPAYEIVTDPEFINALTATLDLRLLLDIAHSAVTAVNSGKQQEEYLGQFDFAQVVQIHLARPRQEGKLCRDAHDALEAEDWQRVAEIMKCCPNLQYVTIEYYKDGQKLIAMLKKLREILQ